MDSEAHVQVLSPTAFLTSLLAVEPYFAMADPFAADVESITVKKGPNDPSKGKFRTAVASGLRATK